MNWTYFVESFGAGDYFKKRVFPFSFQRNQNGKWLFSTYLQIPMYAAASYRFPISIYMFEIMVAQTLRLNAPSNIY